MVRGQFKFKKGSVSLSARLRRAGSESRYIGTNEVEDSVML